MQQYLKAVYGAVVAGLGAAATAYAQGGGHIGWQSGIFIASAALGALAVVWGVPNKPAPPAPPAA